MYRIWISVWYVSLDFKQKFVTETHWGVIVHSVFIIGLRDSKIAA